MIKLSYLIDFSTGVLAFFLAILIAGMVAKWVLHNPEIAILMQLFAISLLVSTVDGTSMAILRVFDKYFWVSAQSVLISLLKLVLLAIIWFLERGTLSNVLLIGYLVSSGIGSLTLLILTWKSVNERFPKYKHISVLILKDHFREIFIFLFSSNANSLLGLIPKQLDKLVLGYLAGAVAVGYYQMAQRFTMVLLLIVEPFYFAIYPELARLWAAGKTQIFRRFVTKSTIAIGTLTIPFALVLFIGAPWLIERTVGEDYLPAVSSIYILLIAVGIALLTFWFQPAILAMGKPHYSAFAMGIGVVAQITCLFILVPRMDQLGGAVAYLFFYIFWGVVMTGFLLIASKQPHIGEPIE